MFTVKPVDGVVATAFKANDKVYISPDKLLPMSRFLPPACVTTGRACTCRYCCHVYATSIAIRRPLGLAPVSPSFGAVFFRRAGLARSDLLETARAAAAAEAAVEASLLVVAAEGLLVAVEEALRLVDAAAMALRGVGSRAAAVEASAPRGAVVVDSKGGSVCSIAPARAHFVVYTIDCVNFSSSIIYLIDGYHSGTTVA